MRGKLINILEKICDGIICTIGGILFAIAFVTSIYFWVEIFPKYSLMKKQIVLQTVQIIILTIIAGFIGYFAIHGVYFIVSYNLGGK